MSIRYISQDGPREFAPPPNSGGRKVRALRAQGPLPDQVRFLGSAASYEEALVFKGVVDADAPPDGRTTVIFQSLLASDPSQRSGVASGSKGPFYLVFPQGRPNDHIERGKGVLGSISFDVFSVANDALKNERLLFKQVIKLLKDFSHEEPPGRD
jgi:hypothetical protein